MLLFHIILFLSLESWLSLIYIFFFKNSWPLVFQPLFFSLLSVQFLSTFHISSSFHLSLNFNLFFSPDWLLQLNVRTRTIQYILSDNLIKPSRTFWVLGPGSVWKICLFLQKRGENATQGTQVYTNSFLLTFCCHWVPSLFQPPNWGKSLVLLAVSFPKPIQKHEITV